MTDQTKQFDIAILGAGILGISLAYHLRKSGLQIAVLERETAVATHASGLNAGMLRQLYRHPQLTKWAQDTISSIPGDIKDACFKETGSIIVGRKAPLHSNNLFKETKVSIGAKSLAAIYTQSDGLLDSPTFVQKLFEEARKSRNLSFYFGDEAIQTSQFSNSWEIKTKNGAKIQAATLVNASGAWINKPISNCPELLVNAQPFARHLFLVTGWPKGFMPHSDCGFYWDEHNNWYLRLWDNESRLVSICDETPAIPEKYIPATSITIDLSERLLQTLEYNVAAKLKVGRSWHCFRTYTDDFLPIWGWDNFYSNFFWLAAFGGFGMSTGFAAAADAASEIVSRGSVIIPDFSVKRVKHLTTKNMAPY